MIFVFHSDRVIATTYYNSASTSIANLVPPFFIYRYCYSSHSLHAVLGLLLVATIRVPQPLLSVIEWLVAAMVGGGTSLLQSTAILAATAGSRPQLFCCS